VEIWGEEMNIEILGRDPTGSVSSQPSIRSGPNRGRRRSEPRGVWVPAGGYAYEARQDAKWAHSGWIKAVQELGHRVGSWDCDGVRNYYVFREAR